MTGSIFVRKHLVRAAVAAVATVSLVTATACSSSSKDAPATKAAASASAGFATKAAKNASWAWTISKVEYAPSFTDAKLGVVKPSTDGTVFCMITTTIKNLKSGTEHYNIHLAEAYEASGNDYEAWAFLYGDHALDAGFDIDANKEVPALMVFQIPPNTKIVKLALGDTFEGAANVDLG
jgi:hypothetical protein